MTIPHFRNFLWILRHYKMKEVLDFFETFLLNSKIIILTNNL